MVDPNNAVEPNKWNASREIRLALLVCLLVSLLDFTVRAFPAWPFSETSSGSGNVEIFERLTPSKAWLDWYKSVQATAEAQAERLREEQRKAIEVKAASPGQQQKRVDQEGDIERLRIGELNYRLWGVFNKSSLELGADVFGVLKADGKTLKLRLGDTLGSYVVKELGSRFVTFESVTGERVVTLWLFGKGPR